MTQPATVDRDQLAVLRLLREQFGEVEVLLVQPSPPLVDKGEQQHLEEPCPTLS
jgi:hypothetical protein